MENNFKKPNPKLWFYITEKWFRLLEFFLIIGIFDYLRHKTDNIYISVVYWISWGLLFSFFIEIAEFFSKIREERQSFRKVIIYFLVMIPFVLITTLLSKVTLIVAESSL